MLENKAILGKINFIYLGLASLVVISLYFFWMGETSELFRLGIALLALFSLWRLYLNDKSPLVYLIVFIDMVILFKYVAAQALISASIIGIITTFVLIFLLFIYHHQEIFHKERSALIGYASLAALMVAEVFFVLTFFPIEVKGKAILAVLFIWLIDEVIANFKLEKLNRGFIISVITIFLVIFGTLALTFPFKIGF